MRSNGQLALNDVELTAIVVSAQFLVAIELCRPVPAHSGLYWLIIHAAN